jgi:ABC-2 type transport system ATP-binding protein
VVKNLTQDQVAEIAFALRIVLLELTAVNNSLEDAYLALTHHDVQYVASTESRKAA